MLLKFDNVNHLSRTRDVASGFVHVVSNLLQILDFNINLIADMVVFNKDGIFAVAVKL